MGKKTPAAPTPPDPVKTAAAQTGTNISTAQANSILGNVNQVTPDGSLTYSQSGQRFVEDGTGGQTYWRGPNGEIQSNAPMQAGTQTTTKQPIYRSQNGKNGEPGAKVISGYKDVVSGAPSTPEAGWSQTKGYYIPQYTATQTLSPAQQAIKDQNDAASLNLGTLANQQSGFLTDYLSRPVDMSSLPAGGDPSTIKAPSYQQFGSGPQLATDFGDAGAITRTYGTDFSADRQRVEDAMFSRLNPQIERDRASNEARLVNQGIRQGSTAWSSAMQDFDRGVNDQRTSITLAGGQEQSRLADLEARRAGFENAAQQQAYQQASGRAEFGNNARQQGYLNESTAIEGNNALEDRTRGAALDRFSADNTTRQTAMSELFAGRNQPLNEISALMSGSQVSNPNFTNTNMPTVPTVDYAGLVQDNYKSQLANWQQQQAQRSAQSQGLLGGLFSLGSSAIMASDRRLKTDVVRVGTGPLGLAIYLFRYVWGGPMEVGVMAQDVARVLPAAVVHMAGGFLAVDYAMIFRREAR